jgi:ribosomal-protein-alanine N-acetyltransferase
MQADSRLPLQEDLPSLTTERLRLRPIRLTDAADVFAYAQEPDVLLFTTGTPPQLVDESSAFLRDALASLHDRMWAIQLHADPRVIGAIELGLQSQHVGSIHYALAKPHWGRGLMTEAVASVCTWAFDTVRELSLIRTTVAEANIGSVRVLEKCGFRLVGTVREHWAKATDDVHLGIFERSRGAGLIQPAL